MYILNLTFERVEQVFKFIFYLKLLNNLMCFMLIK